jgi:hypothetical protein
VGIVDEAEFVERFPRLYHMAEDGSCPSIQQHGLLSTVELLEAYEVAPAARHEILAQRRATSHRIRHPEFGEAVVRDQAPLSDSALSRVLSDDLTPTDWYQILNRHVFLWPTKERLERLLEARLYRDRTHLVLSIDTRKFVDRVGDRIRLSPINSGSTLFNAQRRGLQTFSTIEAYPFEYWRRRRTRPTAIGEVAVVGGIPDIMDVVVDVTRRRGSVVTQTLHDRRVIE